MTTVSKAKYFFLSQSCFVAAATMALLQVANFEIFAAGNVRRHRRRPRDLEKSERQLARAHTVKHKIPIRGHKKNARFLSKWKQKVIHKCKPNEPLYYFLQRSK